APGDQRRRALPATDAESADRVSPPASRRHLSMIRGFHLADFLTLGNAACGVLAIFAVMAYLEMHDVRRLLAATALIPVALALDVLDGRVARSRRRRAAARSRPRGTLAASSPVASLGAVRLPHDQQDAAHPEALTSVSLSTPARCRQGPGAGIP